MSKKKKECSVQMGKKGIVFNPLSNGTHPQFRTAILKPRRHEKKERFSSFTIPVQREREGRVPPSRYLKKKL